MSFLHLDCVYVLYFSKVNTAAALGHES